MDPFAPIKQIKTAKKIKVALGDTNPLKTIPKCLALGQNFTEASRNEFSARIYDFTWELQAALNGNKLGSTVVSPLGVAMMLQFVKMGGKRKILAAFRDNSTVFASFSRRNAEKCFASVQNYIGEIPGNVFGEHTQLFSTNIMFVDSKHRIRYEFRDKVVGCLGSLVFVSNFRSNHSRRLQEINRSIRGALQEPNMVFTLPLEILNSDPELFLFNGLYFGAKFGSEPGQVYRRKFHMGNDLNFPAKMTYLKGKFGRYREPIMDLHVVGIDSIDRLHTLFILVPSKIGNLESFGDKIDGSYMLQLMSNLDYFRSFAILMPDFKVTVA